MKNPLPERQDVRDRGRVYYNYYCVFCHGDNGQGDGPVGYSYMPAPTDLHAPKIVADVRRRPDARHAARHRARTGAAARGACRTTAGILYRIVRALGKTPRHAGRELRQPGAAAGAGDAVTMNLPRLQGEARWDGSWSTEVRRAGECGGKGRLTLNEHILLQ